MNTWVIIAGHIILVSSIIFLAYVIYLSWHRKIWEKAWDSLGGNAAAFFLRFGSRRTNIIYQKIVLIAALIAAVLAEISLIILTLTY
jgi:hypothetical protein